jgi:hypothetical protein
MKKEIKRILGFIIFAFFITNISLFAEDAKKYDYKDFTGVSVGWGMHVKIEQADSYSVEVKASEKNLRYLKVEKSGNKLKFFFEEHSWFSRGDIYISIKMPELTELGLSGGSQGKIKMNIANKSFSGDLSGGSELHGDLKCANIDLSLSGGSEVGLEGSGKDLKIDGSGGSEFKMKNFSAADVDAELSGGSEAEVKMNGKLDIEASGGSELTFYGKATYGHTSLSGGSEVTQGD